MDTASTRTRMSASVDRRNPSTVKSFGLNRLSAQRLITLWSYNPLFVASFQFGTIKLKFYLLIRPILYVKGVFFVSLGVL